MKRQQQKKRHERIRRPRIVFRPETINLITAVIGLAGVVYGFGGHTGPGPV